MPRELGVTALYPVPQRSGVLHGQRSCERLADGLLAVHRRQDELSGTRSPGLEEQLHRGARLARQLTTARLPCSLIVDERLLVDVLKDDINRCQRTGHKCPDADLADDRVTDVVDGKRPPRGACQRSQWPGSRR